MTDPPTKPVPSKPLPTITEENRPFWDAAACGELRMQRCLACGHIRHPIQALCPVCLSTELDWQLLSGRGTIFAKVVYHRAFNPAWAADVPYNVVLVQLDEGPRMYGNVLGSANDAFGIGDAVEVVFDPVSEDISVPRFRLR
jgi:uncharacterized OB-fold protein